MFIIAESGQTALIRINFSLNLDWVKYNSGALPYGEFLTRNLGYVEKSDGTPYIAL